MYTNVTSFPVTAIVIVCASGATYPSIAIGLTSTSAPNVWFPTVDGACNSFPSASSYFTV